MPRGGGGGFASGELFQSRAVSRCLFFSGEPGGERSLPSGSHFQNCHHFLFGGGGGMISLGIFMLECVATTATEK